MWSGCRMHLQGEGFCMQQRAHEINGSNKICLTPSIQPAPLFPAPPPVLLLCPWLCCCWCDLSQGSAWGRMLLSQPHVEAALLAELSQVATSW